MLNKPRVHAFLIHLASSLVIFLIPLYLIVFHWYPPPLFFADGGWRGIKIIVAVYLVIGPLLTLIIYKPGKWGLKFDLVTIGILQTAALVWGTWSAYAARPVALVYTVNYFTTVSSQQLLDTGFALPKLKSFGNKSPVYIYVDLPQDPQKQLPLLAKSVDSNTPLFLFTDLYKDFAHANLQLIKQHSDALVKHLTTDPIASRLLEGFTRKNGFAINDFLYIPLNARRQRLVMVVDATDLSVKGSLDIDVTNFLLNIK